MRQVHALGLLGSVWSQLGVRLEFALVASVPGMRDKHRANMQVRTTMGMSYEHRSRTLTIARGSSDVDGKMTSASFTACMGDHTWVVHTLGAVKPSGRMSSQ